MQRIKGSHGRRPEKRGARSDRFADLDHAHLCDDLTGLDCEFRRSASHGTHNLDLDDRARDLIRIGREQLAQRLALGLLDDEFDERRRVDVDQSRSSR